MRLDGVVGRGGGGGGGGGGRVAIRVISSGYALFDRPAFVVFFITYTLEVSNFI